MSWLREPSRGDASETGYRLWFNRDEIRSRGPEIPAALHDRRGVAVLAPTDSDHGGTWIGVNEFGLTLGLLNGYGATRAPDRGATRSRGLLVADLGDAPTVEVVRARATRSDLSPFEPFILLAVAPGEAALALRWDGVELVCEGGDDELRPLVSSGVEQPAAQRVRRALYEQTLERHGGLRAAALEAFQASHGDGPSAFTPCMHRPEAETRSQVRVAVDAATVELIHVPGPPCRTAPLAALRLELRSTGATPTRP